MPDLHINLSGMYELLLGVGDHLFAFSVDIPVIKFGNLTPNTEKASHSQASHHGRRKLIGTSEVIHHLFNNEEATTPEADLRPHLEAFFESAKHYVVILTLVI